MSDLITFPLSQLARALGTVPLPGRRRGSSTAQTVCATTSLTKPIMEKWRSLPLTWYWKTA
jgi:hypothetical protein